MGKYDFIDDEDSAQQVATDSPAPVSKNIYDRVFDEEEWESSSQLQQSMFVAAEKNPDRHAQVLNLSQRMNLPPSFVDTNFDELQKKEIKSKDYSTELAQVPGLRKFLSEPDNAIVAKDDVANLERIEKDMRDNSWFNTIAGATETGIFNMAAGAAKTPAFAWDLTAWAANQTIGQGAGGEGIFPRAPDFLRKNAVTEFFDDAAKVSASFVPALDSDPISAFKTGGAEGVAKSLVANVFQSAPQMLSIMNVAKAGAVQSLAYAGSQAGAQKYDENLKAGVSPETALVNATVNGLLEGGLETLGTGGLLKSWEGALEKSLGKATKGEVMKAFAKQLAYAGLGEATEEGVTSITQDLNDVITGVNPKAYEGMLLRAANASLIGAASGVGIGSPSAVAMSAPQLQQVAEATRNRNFLLSLGDNLKASKLRERSPEIQKKYVEALRQDGAINDVYINPEFVDAYFQGDKGNAVQIMTDLGVLKAYEDAKETNQPIKIPIQEWAAKIVGTPAEKALANDITLGPPGPKVLSYNEAQKQRADLQAQMAEAATPAVPVEDVAQEDQRAQIEVDVRSRIEQVVEQARAINPNTPIDAKQIDAAVEVLTRQTAIRAQELGLTAEEAIDQVPIFQLMRAQQVAQEDALTQPPIPDDSLPQISVLPDHFSSPEGKGDVQLPDILPQHLAAIGAENKPLVLKENIAIKNRDNHKEIAPARNAEILQQAIYAPDEIIQSKPGSKPNYWTFIKSDEKSKISVIEISEGKDQYEIVNWYEASPKFVEKIRSRAKREGGRFLITEGLSSQGAADLSALPSNPNSKVTQSDGDGQLYQGTVDQIKPIESDTPEVAQAKDLLRSIDTAEKATALKGKERGQYLTALDLIYGDRQARAKSLGFGETMYHGTNKSFAAFNTNNLGESGRLHGEAYFATTSPEVADQFAQHSAELDYIKNRRQAHEKMDWDLDGKLEKRWLKLEKEIARLKDGVKKDRLTVEANRVNDQRLDLRYQGQQVIPVRLRIALPYTSDARGAYFDQKRMDRVFLNAKADLADGIYLQNLLDNPSENGDVISDVAAVFNASQIRSTYAAFDPRFADSSLLLAQSGAAKSAPRGSYSPMQNILRLSAEGDISTLLHEMTHFWAFQLANDHSYLKTLTDLKEGEQRRVKLGDDLLKWLKIDSFDQMTRDHHEKLAETGEAYFMTGKAPTQGLRKMFSQLKVWMTQVYKHITAIGQTVDPEIKSFFDRMIASEEEIALAEQSAGITPLFGEASTFGLKGETGQKYQRAVERTRLKAQEILTTQLMDGFQKQREDFYKEQRDANRERIATEVAYEPGYRAAQILQKAMLPNGDMTDPIKLSKEVLRDSFDQDLVKRLPRGISNKEEGIHPDIAAELLGFKNGAEMLYNIAALENRTERIERLTDEHMAKAYPDLINNPQAVREQAREALDNIPRAKLYAMELEILASDYLPALKTAIRQTAKRTPPGEEVKAMAARMLGEKTIKEIRPIDYQRAENKNANLAREALARGDFQGAYDFTRKALLNLELSRQAIEAREEIEKHLNRFAKFKKSDEDVAKSRDVNLVNAGRAILAVYGLTPNTKKTAAEFLAPIKEYDPQAFEGVMAQVLSAVDGAANYKTITYDKFTEMATTVQALWDLAKSNRQMEIDGKKIDLNEIQVDLQGRLLEYQGPDAKAQYEKAASNWDKIKMNLMGARAALTRVEYWAKVVDGGRGGPFTKYIFQPVAEASTKFRIERVKVMEKYKALVKDVRPSLSEAPIQAAEFGYEFKNKAELLGALLHTGNSSNFRKLMLGSSESRSAWGQQFEDGSVDSTKWDTFIARMQSDGTLTKADYDFVQGVWDLFESLKPDTQRAHKSIYGFYFNEITADKIQTPWGVYRGGYAPAKYDPIKDQRGAINRDKEGLQTEPTSFVFPSTGKGATMSRKDFNGVLSMDLNMVKSHIDWSMRFTYLQPVVNQVARIITNQNFNKALGVIDPTVRGDMLVPWLQRAASQTISTPSQGFGGKALDAVARALRSRTGFGMMVLNVVNTLQQVGTLPMAAVNIHPKYLAQASGMVLKDLKNVNNSVAEKSDFMKTRMDNQIHAINGEINDLLVSPTKYEDLRAWTEKHGYILQSGLQNYQDSIVWLAGYNQATEQGMLEREAIRFADSEVRTTQNSYNPEDVSRFETGTPFTRVFTQFYSFFNNWANLGAAEFQLAVNEMGLKKSAGRLLYVYMMAYLIPNIANDSIMRSLSGKGLDEDDDGDYIGDILDIIFGSQYRTLTAMVPGVGPALRAGINTYNKKPYDDRISASPAISMLESTGKTLVGKPFYDLSQGKNQKQAIRDVLSTISLLTGVPVVPLAKPAGYLTEVNSGKIQPTGPIDFARGLVTGK